MNHSLSSKSTSWDQIPTNIATAVICLLTNIRNINAKVAGKPVTVSEASIRSSLLFDDANGIDSLNNQAIFDAIQTIGHLDAKKKFVMYPKFISIFLGTQLKDVPIPVDHFPVPALTSKVFSFMVKKGKHFSGKVTPLFLSMLVQPIEDEGEGSDRPSAPQPTPSPPHTSKALDEPWPEPSSQPTPSPSHQTVDLPEPIPAPTPSPITPIPDSIPQGDDGNTGAQSSNDRSFSGKIKALKAQVKKLKRRAIPVINHHKAWLRTTRMKKRKGVFKQGRKVVKSSKGQSSAHKDLAFEDFKDDFEAPLDDVIDYLRTEEVKDDVSTALHQVSTDRAREGTDAQKVSTDAQKVSTDSTKVSTDLVEEGTTKPGDEQVLTNDQVEESTDKLENVEPKEQTSTPTTPITITTTFGDDETIAKVLLNMSQARAVSREKEKGVELKDVEESERPRPSSIEAEEEKKRLAEEEAINAALVQELDDVKVRIEAGRLLALRLQEEERDQFAIEERAKFQHDTIAAQRIFLAKQRSAAIRSKPPTKT
ncbi:hypothetical protein Tco_0744579 [Tanacetum coccineum]